MIFIQLKIEIAQLVDFSHYVITSVNSRKHHVNAS